MYRCGLLISALDHPLYHHGSQVFWWVVWQGQTGANRTQAIDALWQEGVMTAGLGGPYWGKHGIGHQYSHMGIGVMTAGLEGPIGGQHDIGHQFSHIEVGVTAGGLGRPFGRPT